MSGGSRNYVYRQDLIAHRADVSAVFDDLTALGYRDAAYWTAEVLGHMQAIGNLQAELEQVWKAVEYYRSGDWTAEQVKEAVEVWGAKKSESERVRLRGG